MVNRRAHPKSLRSLMVLTVLAIPSAVISGGAPQDVRTKDVGPGFPRWCLLPRTPFSPALWADDTQPIAESTEDHAAGSALNGRSKRPEAGSGSAFAASQPVPVPPSQAVRPGDQPLAQSYDGLQTTDQESPLMIPSIVVWQRVSQAISALRTELAFPSLLAPTPLSPALWIDDLQTVAALTEDQAAGSVQVGGSKPFETESGSAFAITTLNPGLTFPSLSPRSPVSPDLWTPDAQPVLQPATQGEKGVALAVPGTVVWQRVSQAITILHVERTFPSLLPRSPVLPDLWTHDAQPAVQQATKGEKRKRETGETAASQPPPVLLATGMTPGDQPLVQGQNESLTTGHGQSATASQTPSAEGHGGTAAASQKASTHAPGEKGAAAPNEAWKSAASEKATTRTSGQPTRGENEKRQRGETSASPTTPAHPSPVASQKVQPTAQGYHGAGATDHASAIALRASAGEFTSAPGGGRALRDPFKLPPPPRPEQEEKDDPKLPGNRPPGAGGLLVEQLKLKGVVRDGATQKMIAVVTTTNNRAYFLREGEAVYDGVVSKITSDAVYFKGNIFDAKREVRSRQVVKTLSPAPGEVR